MKKDLFCLDPDGDVELILRLPNFHRYQDVMDVVKEEEEEEEEKEEKENEEGSDTPIEAYSGSIIRSIPDIPALRSIKPRGEDGSVTELRFVASSSHLKLASSVFRKMLLGPWKEGELNDQGRYNVTTKEWDAEAFLIVFDIVHGHHRSIPQIVALETLARIATVVDYYDCHEIVDIFVQKWTDSLAIELPTVLNRDVELWMCISHVFENSDIFQKVASIALRDSQQQIVVLDLPIPNKLLAQIEAMRVDAFKKALSRLNELCDYLCDSKRYKCLSDCSTFLLGSLMKQMYENEVSSSFLHEPFHGYSIAWLKRKIKTFHTPPGIKLVHKKGWDGTRSCKVEDLVDSVLDKLYITVTFKKYDTQ